MSSVIATIPSRPMPLRLPRICVAVSGTNPSELLEKAEAVARDNPFVEFRLDYLKQPALALPRIKSFLGSHTYVTAIGTCRRAANGGKFKGSIAAEVDLLIKAGQSGCHLVDIELQSAQSLKAADFHKIRAHAGLVLSFHDFKATKKLNETFAAMQQYPADIFKVVGTATNLYDNVTLMKFLEQQSHDHKMVGICMGEQGLISRVLGLRAGSMFTFGALSPGEETAPGQVTAKELRDAYRIENVDAATRVYGVAGDPIEHSLSPQMINAAFRRENLNSVYLALHAKNVDDVVKCVRDIPMHGLSITMPFKQGIMEHLDNCEPLCQKVGACNTVIRGADGKLYGFNTDVAGITRPLDARLHLANARILVLGAGGAARAAVFGLRERGAQVFILNRTPQTAQKLARESGAKSIRRDDLKKVEFDVIINATPVGMGSGSKTILDEKEMNAKLAFDLVYNPIETRFLQMARAKGMAVISGIEMFVHQGARQFEIWTGKPAPLAEMQQVVLAELQNRAARAPVNGRHEVKLEASPEPKAKSEPKPEPKAASKPSSKPAKKAAKKARK